jgi:hypothetical protein
MKEPVVIIGMGEMGAVFARAFVKSGYPVYPVTRSHDMAREAKSIPGPALVLLAVGESDLCAVLETLPEQWRQKVSLLQNELLPHDWKKHNLTEPTIISAWFEKKPGQDFKVLLPSPVYGPNARLMKEALSSLDIPVDLMADETQLLQQLVTKNLYILTTNICGLETGGNVKQLWDDHTILMNRVFDDLLLIQQYLCATTFDRDPLMISLLNAFDADPEHKCMGRSAPQRLQRALQISVDAGIQVPELQRISRNTP